MHPESIPAALPMYGELAAWWPLLSAPADYAEEAAFFLDALREAGDGRVETLLELGSGGGNNASHMKAHVHATLVDLAPGMLDVSRALNPECKHIQGDMRAVRLGTTFDAVFLHDAVSYLTCEQDVRAAVETAFLHTRPGGVALFCPDYIRETFAEDTEHGGHDADGRGLRYLAWTWDPDPSDTTYTVDYAYLLRDADGTVRTLRDRHVEGLFRRTEWMAWLAEAGFAPHILPFNHSELGDKAMEVFVGVRPG